MDNLLNLDEQESWLSVLNIRCDIFSAQPYLKVWFDPNQTVYKLALMV